MRNFIINGWWLLAIVLGFAACKDDIHDFTQKTGSEAAGNIYIADTIFHVSLSWDADTVNKGDTLWIRFPVYVTEPAKSDIKVTLTTDNQLFDRYNKLHGTSYVSLAPDNLATTMTVVIPEGKTRSDSLISIACSKKQQLLDTNGYLIPVRISAYRGTDVAINYEERHSYIFVNVARDNGVYFNTSKSEYTSWGSMVTATGVRSMDMNLNSYSFNLNTYFKVADTSTATISVNNALIAAYNTANGGDYQPIPENDLAQSYKVGFKKGENVKSFKLSYTGDHTTLTDKRGYLIPLEITTVEGEGLAMVTAKRVFYVVLNITGNMTVFNIVANADAMTGTRVTDRTNYNVIKAVNSSGVAFTPSAGQFNEIFIDDYWYKTALPGFRFILTIDLGTEVQNITGVQLAGGTYYASSASYNPKALDMWYATEEMYAAKSNVFLGRASFATGRTGNWYIKFDEPAAAARYIILDVTCPSSYGTGLNSFSIYTQE